MYVLEFNEKQIAFHLHTIESRSNSKNNEEWRIVMFGDQRNLNKLHTELTKDNPKTLDDINTIIRVRKLEYLAG